MKPSAMLLAVFAAVIPVSPAEETNCKKVALSTLSAVKGKPVDQLLDLVSSQIKSSPKCSCEIVKGAIKGAKPTPQTVAAMVDTGIQAAPDYVDVILACAYAAAPDALDEITAIGEKYGKTFNPLDFPGLFGTDPKGQYIFTPDTPVFVNPPQVTFVDP